MTPFQHSKNQVDGKRKNMGWSTMFKENIIKERF